MRSYKEVIYIKIPKFNDTFQKLKLVETFADTDQLLQIQLLHVAEKSLQQLDFALNVNDLSVKLDS